MPWLSLGSISLTEQWQTFPQPSLGYEIFRLTHDTIVDPYVNSAFLSMYFPAPGDGGRLSPWRRIYPSEQATLIELKVPQDLRNKGVVIFSVQMRWRLPYYPTPWNISLEGLA